MAQNGRVMPNCLYASNPYHECTEACLHKLKETKPPKNKKSSDYRRSVTDGELGKKMNEEKRTHSGCPKASNPYHKCDENCHKRMSGADSGVINNFERKSKLGSKPELPVLDNIPPSKIGAIYLSDATSPISTYYEKKKVEPKSNELIPVSGELHKPNSMPINHKVQPKDVAGPIQTKQVDKNASPKVVPVTSVDDTGEGLTPTSAGGSMHFEHSDGEETESVVSESRVPVGRYHVKESFASILRSIFDKHGDIGATCHLESVVMRSYYIECVCFVVQELQSTSIMQLTKSKVKELLAILKDVESAQLNVAWLRSIVDEIAENIELINEHRAVEVAKENSDQEMESLRKELESEMETMAQKEQEVSDIKTRIEEMRKRLSELEVKSSDLDKNMLSIKSKVDNLDSKSLLDELL
ncbi:Phospholipase-like [Sesbania bispinosa]|nr:Phospholipase-like [Sesbania bispinosa]